ESLNAYTITAPIGGVVVKRSVDPGEQTAGKVLMEVMDPSQVRAELTIPVGQRGEVRIGDPVSLRSALDGSTVAGRVDRLALMLNDVQALSAWAALDNPEGELLPGTFVQATITTGEFEVPLAVKRSGLQAFRDF